MPPSPPRFSYPSQAKAREQREAQLVAQLEELRVEMQRDINSLRAELAEAKILAKQGQCLANRVVLVSGGGAACGVGRDVASRLVMEGAKVIIIGPEASSAKGKVRCDVFSPTGGEGGLRLAVIVC